MTSPHLLQNWIPINLTFHPTDGWQICWLDFRDKAFAEPFFEETISIARARQCEGSALKSWSDMNFLMQAAETIPSLAPTAFIFHVSRCGSTLLTQACSTQEENIVISEAPILDEVLRAAEKDPAIGNDQAEKWFKAALNLMGQQRNFTESTFIIKLDCWHIHFYDQLRNWFPDTPFFFLSRRPDEVLASHDKRRGMHAVPGLISKSLLKIDPTIDYGGDFNAYTADVLQQLYHEYSRVSKLHDPKNYFFDYADGVEKMVLEFSLHTAIEIHNPEQLSRRLNYHSKYAGQVFKGDPAPAEEKFFYQNCMTAYHQLLNNSK